MFVPYVIVETVDVVVVAVVHEECLYLISINININNKVKNNHYLYYYDLNIYNIYQRLVPRIYIV